MIKSNFWSLTAALLFGVVGPLASPAAQLGDPAPPLLVQEWIKGGPVNLAKGRGTNIFVIEFWATWCGPCRTSIPHLTELQKKFQAKGVIFVGLSDEPADTVKPFVKKLGASMDYAVGVDKENGTTAAYMEAFGVRGIPHAFVVDREGRIVWQGHPMENLERTLTLVVEGKYDLDSEKKRSQAEKLMEEFYDLAAEDKDRTRQDEIARQIQALDKELKGIVRGQTFDAAEVRRGARFEFLIAEYRKLAFSNPAAAEAAARQAAPFAPKNFSFDDYRLELELQRMFFDYYRAVAINLDPEKAADLKPRLLAAKVKKPELLNQLAWTLLHDERIQKRDLDLAKQLAKRAVDATDGKSATELDTYAHALFAFGDVTGALQTEKKALELAKEADLREHIQKALEKFQAKPGAAK